MERDGSIFHHATQNVAHFKTYELFISVMNIGVHVSFQIGYICRSGNAGSYARSKVKVF